MKDSDLVQPHGKEQKRSLAAEVECSLVQKSAPEAGI